MEEEHWTDQGKAGLRFSFEVEQASGLSSDDDGDDVDQNH
jgi:hypothetical protein